MVCERCRTLTLAESGVSGWSGYGKPGPGIKVAVMFGFGGEFP